MKTKTRGQALTEFALILPILLLLLLGIIEGARIIWAYVQIQNAAREAARYAITGQPFDAQGEPWSPTIPDADRVAAIKQVAADYTTGLGISVLATTVDDYEAYASTPGAFGVLVKGQRTAVDPEGEADYAGKPGLNVLVQLYYNVQMLDPIYAALLPQGWVRVNAQLVMQNEGVDTTASGLAPVGLGAEPPPVGGGDDPPPGGSRVPKISIVEAQPVPAGTTITILLEDHAPSTTYNVYFDGQLVGTVTTSALFFAQIDYYLPISTSPGEHSIHSELPGTGSAAANTTIMVDQPTGPAIAVDGGTRWPAGSPITIRIFSHDPTTSYNIFFGGAQIGTITTDATGSGSLNYVISSAQLEGSVHIEARTTGGTETAGTDILIIEPEIVVQGGTVWPQGTRIYIFLRDHAPNQTYSVYFGTTLINGAVTTNAVGEAILSHNIPWDAPDGTYVLRSEQGASTIAQLDIQVATPQIPYILVVGGYEWPAGSPITIQLRKHPDADYDVKFGDNYVGRYTTSSGEVSIAYIIPITQSEGIHSLRSLTTGGVQVATVDVSVTAVPAIIVDGGLTQAPGATITIRLIHHAENGAYDVYLGGTKIGTVITDGSGQATLTYTIPAGTTPGNYTLESKPKDETTAVASAILRVEAPDLTVTSLETPTDLQINSPIPITITVKNQSEKAISNQYFDVDLYIDPTLAPTSGDAGLPPGSRKYWYNSVPASGTLTINDTVTLWGAQAHQLYARADTSGNILEGDETNNILGKVVASSKCSTEITEEFPGTGSLPASWLIQNYGDADPAGTASLDNGQLSLHSEGRSTWVSDDSSRGFQFVYNQQQVSGDFDVYVQVISHVADNSSVSGKAGLEIRKSLGSQDVKLDWVIYQGYRLQGGQRASSGGGMSQIGSYVYPASPYLPIWLRIVRQGDEFSLYYTTVSTTPPQPGDWVYAVSTTLGNMGPTVTMGVINASYVNNVASTSKFDYFHLCGDPAGTTTCGEVKETGGAVFVDARNYTDNVIRSGKTWVNTTRSGLYGMHVVDANAAPIEDSSQAPELQYQVKFATSGRYYVALLGWGPDGDSDSVHMGLAGTIIANLGNFTTASGDPPGWIRNSGWYFDIPSAGSYTINLYMREDGAQVYKIALFKQVDYPLDGFGPSQSECSATAPDDIPPGLTVCNQMLVNGDFEGDLSSEVDPYWIYSAQEQVTRVFVHYITTGTSFGFLMPSSIVAGTPRQPWLYQEFVMPDWVLTSTTATLDLQKAQDWLTTPNNEPLYFYLRSSSGITLTNPVPVANGQDLPDIDPFNYSNAHWSHLSVDVLPYMAAAGYDPVNFAGQTLQAYFFSPNPGTNSSEFYLDKVNLNVCTAQPRPDPFSTRLTGRTMINQSLKSGVNVWAYKMQGGGEAGGPVYTTYSIQDGTYDFYDLSAGIYLIYAEYWLSGTRYWNMAYATVPSSGTVTKDLVLYP